MGNKEIEGLRSPEKINFSQVSIMFPGQGSQFPGMGLDLYRESLAARAVFEEADYVLGMKFSELMLKGSESKLRQTINAQPAILICSVAALRALEKEVGKKETSKVKFVAGHSLGEYSALVAAGAITFADTICLVRERGRLMEEAGKFDEGSMVAILGLSVPDVDQICRDTQVQFANDNCNGQVVISGSKANLEKAVKLSYIKGAKKAIALEVSGAFHSLLMSRAVKDLERILKEKRWFKNFKTPVISNVTGKPIGDAVDIVDELKQQLYSCVRWRESVEYMKDHGAKIFLELGPGEVLTSLAKRIGGNQIKAMSLGSMDSIRSFAS